MALERLQKIISRAGITSRRKAEELIVTGRVVVNGEVIRELGSKADTSVDHVKVDGRQVRPPTRMIYLALHKPKEYVTTLSDPEHRPTVMDLLKKVKDHIYPVGRLDYHSEGLLLLTNDGDFANRLTAASSGFLKTYWVKVKGSPEEKDIERLRKGILLDGRRTLPARIRLLRTTAPSPIVATRRGAVPARARINARNHPQLHQRVTHPFKAAGPEHSASRATVEDSANSWYEVIISEGRQNQIRRMFSLIGHPVQKLKRTQVGPVSLGTLPTGQFRPLTLAEVRQVQSPKGTRL
jgi:23S rRNA pseudouridine2605 synthase